MAVYTRIQVRRDSAANWTSVNPLLGEGEIGLETDTGKFKIGDNTNQWTALGYRGGPVSAFVLTLLDDTTAGAFMTTLGVTSAAQTMLALSNVVGVRHTVSASINDTNIKALPTTPQTILATPGSGFIAVPLFVYIKVSASAGLYTNINAAAEIEVKYTGASGKSVLSSVIESDGQVTKLIGTASTNASVKLGGAGDAGTLAAYEDEVLVITANNQGSGDFTGGNGANTMVVTVEYIVIPV